MEVISRDEIKRLSENSERPCLTITMPVYRKGAEMRQNPVRLRNLLREAEEQLGRQAGSYLGEIRMQSDAPDFWAHPGDGFVLYCVPGLTRFYHLPFDVDEKVHIGERFHLAPLIRAMDDGSKYWILALSQNEVRLVLCSRRGAAEAPLPDDVPRNLVESTRFDDPEHKTGMLHANPSGKPHLHGGRETTQGSGMPLLEAFLRRIDRGLHGMFRNQSAPLVLASVEFLQPIYQGVNTYPHLVEKGVPGNPEGLSPAELDEKARPLVEPIFKAAQREAAERFGIFSADGRASKVLPDILAAARGGRVDSLFVSAGLLQWGQSDLNVDDAAIETLLHGGAIYAVDPEEIPDSAPVAAVYRY